MDDAYDPPVHQDITVFYHAIQKKCKNMWIHCWHKASLLTVMVERDVGMLIDGE